MKVSVFLSVLCITVASSAAKFEEHVHERPENLTEVERAFIHHELKDRIHTLPMKKLIIHFDTDKKVNLGTEFSPKDTKNPPSVIYETEPDTFYTLIVFDLDSPRRNATFFGEVIIWQVVNIPGSKVHKGDTLVEYAHVWPSKHSGMHRVVFLLFQQKDKHIFNEKYIPRTFISSPNRIGFSTTKFAMKYNLGRPIAGNFFESQFDESFMNDLDHHYWHRH